MRLLVPVVVLRLLWRSRDHAGYRSHIRRRFGWYGHDRPEHAGQRIWIHAVSVGETLAVIPLIERLLAERPDLRVLITSTTPTGADQVQQKLGNSVDWDWAPFDTPGAVKRFFDHWHPALSAFVETEIWPNILTQAAARGADCSSECAHVCALGAGVRAIGIADAAHTCPVLSGGSAAPC